MSVRDLIEFDGKPGTSATDIATAIVVFSMIAVVIATICMVVIKTLS